MEGKSVVMAVTGMIVAYGPTDPRVQKVILAHCKQGGAEVMKECLAQVMVDEGIAHREIPSPVGIKTKELVDRVQDALVEMCRKYLNDGGVLVARRYVPLEDLYASMLKFWHLRFMKPLKDTPTVIDGMPQQEMISRLAIAARAARAIVHEKMEQGRVDFAHGEVYILKEEHLESFCMAIAKAAYEGFHKPDEMVHRMVHGKEEL